MARYLVALKQEDRLTLRTAVEECDLTQLVGKFEEIEMVGSMSEARGSVASREIK